MSTPASPLPLAGLRILARAQYGARPFATAGAWKSSAFAMPERSARVRMSAARAESCTGLIPWTSGPFR